MFKTIQEKLKDASILDRDEPILSFVKVVDYRKHQQLFKKILKEELSHVLPSNKSYYLLVTSKKSSIYYLNIFYKIAVT